MAATTAGDELMHAYLQARAPCCAVTGSEKKEGGQQMIEEACLPWTPLPERFSGSWQVDVVHVAEADSADIRPFETLAIAVAAYAEPTATYGNLRQPGPEKMPPGASTFAGAKPIGSGLWAMPRPTR